MSRTGWGWKRTRTGARWWREVRTGWGWWYPRLVAAYAGQRLVELWLSRRHARALAAAGLPRARERGFPLIVTTHLLPIVAGPVEAEWRRRRGMAPPRVLVAGALATLAAAGALRAWTLAALGPSWTVRVHAGPTMAVATRGPYRYVRHPNYLAVILEVAALPLAGGAFATALGASLLDAVALSLRIGDEERALRRSPAWRQAMADRPRLLPRIAPRARPRA